MPALLNTAGFWLFWLLLLISAYLGWDLFICGLLFLWLGLHLFFSPCRGADLRVALLAIILGPLCDALAIQLGLVEFRGYQPIAALPPLWMYAQWLNFSLLLNHGIYRWSRRWRPMSLLGAGCAVLAYLAAELLGALDLQGLALPYYAASWMLIMPLVAMGVTRQRGERRGIEIGGRTR